MKKIGFGMMVCTLLIIASCSKNNSSNNSNNAWTFKNVTYNVTTCTKGGNSIYAQSVPANNTANASSVTFYFYSIPTVSGTYTLCNLSLLNSSSQVAVTSRLNGNSSSYTSTGGSGNQSINVTVAGGKISISGAGIEMANDINNSDSSALSVNIMQTQ